MTVTCIKCGNREEVPITASQVSAWQGGEMIQNAAPNLTVDQREILISGLCGLCFDSLFASDCSVGDDAGDDDWENLWDDRNHIESEYSY